MPRKCFLSFYYKADNWRVQQIKNMGAIDEQPLLAPNKWEEIEKKGDEAIKRWIDDNLKGKECLIVLIGSLTSGRRWVKYEIQRACEMGIGVLGVHIHNLKDKDGKQSTKGTDPFHGVVVNSKFIATYAKSYDPPSSDSTKVYEYISQSLSGWIEQAIRARK